MSMLSVESNINLLIKLGSYLQELLNLNSLPDENITVYYSLKKEYIYFLDIKIQGIINKERLSKKISCCVSLDELFFSKMPDFL